MSGVLCVWANLVDSAIDWYSNEFIDAEVSKADCFDHALHCEVTASGMEGEAIGKLDSPWRWFAVYETNDLQKATDRAYTNPNWPKDETLIAQLKKSRFDVRAYTEVKRWQSENWDGDAADIASVAAMEWSIPAGMEDKVMDFYINAVGPTISSSPDVLRFRLFKVSDAITWDHQEHSVVDTTTLHTYFTLVEIATDEWPWSVVVDLAEDERWKSYFETQTVVKWQLSHYLVQSSYPEHDDAAGSDTGDEGDEEEDEYHVQ